MVLHDEVSLSPDGSLTAPPQLLKRLATNDAVLTPLAEGGLGLYPQAAWEFAVAEFDRLPDVRQEARLMIDLMRSNTSACQVGKGGRIEVPPALRRLAGLDELVLVVAARDHLQLWDPQTWARRARPDAQSRVHDVA